MKKTVITLSLVFAASSMYPNQDTFSGRFGGVTQNATSHPETTRKMATKAGPDSFDSRFGGSPTSKKAVKASHSMTGATDPAAQKALNAGGPVGLAKYMIRKMANALGYGLNEMIDLVQSAMGDSSKPVAAPSKTTRKASAPTSFQARF